MAEFVANLWQICGNEKGTPLGVPIRLYSEIIYTVLLVLPLQMYIGLGGKTHRFVSQHLGHKLGVAVCQLIQFGCTGVAERVQTRLLNICQSQQIVKPLFQCPWLNGFTAIVNYVPVVPLGLLFL